MSFHAHVSRMYATGSLCAILASRHSHNSADAQDMTSLVFMQDYCTQAPYNPFHGRGSCAGHQLGVLHHPKRLPSAQSFSLLLHTCQLVWLAPLDLLEHSK